MVRLFAAVAGFVALSLSPGAAASPLPSYEKVECWFPLYEGERSECGYLTVAENRGKPDGRKLQLAVVILRARLAIHYTDPIVIINGGPGSELGLDPDGIKGWRKLMGQIPAWHQRDVILLEQRGTGKSLPNLECQEERDASVSVLQQNIGTLDVLREYRTATKACHTRLISEGHDLSAYTSAEMASDIADLRQALRYDLWNLYGSSYGSRIALTVMRDHPQGLRSAILDSVMPVEADQSEFGWRWTQAALERALDVCAERTNCPGGAKAFQQFVRQYNEAPVKVPQRPAGEGRTIDVWINGGALVEIMIDWLAADPSAIGYVHLSAKERSPEYLAPFVDYMIAKYSNGQGLSEGVFNSVHCNEESAFARPMELKRDMAAYWQWVDLPEMMDVPEAFANFCNDWQMGSPSPLENEAVVSDIPALLLVGEFDPLTPPDLAKSTRHNLRNSYGFEFMNAGHGLAISHPCARATISAFLDRPEERPNALCLAGNWAREF